MRSDVLKRQPLLDAASHRRSPATKPGYHRGRPPKNKGPHFPAGPPSDPTTRRPVHEPDAHHRTCTYLGRGTTAG